MKTCEDVQNRQPVDTLPWTCTLTYRCMHRCTAVRTDSRLKLTGEPTQCCITPVYNRCWKTGMITHAREWMGWDILAAADTQTFTQAGGLASLCSVIAPPCIRVFPWWSLMQEQVQRAPMVLLAETLHTHTQLRWKDASSWSQRVKLAEKPKVYLRRRKMDKTDRQRARKKVILERFIDLLTLHWLWLSECVLCSD